MLGRGVDDARAENFGESQGFDALLAFARDFDERELTLDGLAADSEVGDAVHRHQSIELIADLRQHHRGAGRDDGEAREASCFVRLGDGQALDIVAAPGEERSDARQHARLVVDQDGKCVPLAGVLALLEEVGGAGAFL